MYLIVSNNGRVIHLMLGLIKFKVDQFEKRMIVIFIGLMAIIQQRNHDD